MDLISRRRSPPRLNGDEREATIRNATDIANAVIGAYGVDGRGELDVTRIPNTPVTGLVYGRIQSGKTRAMIASTALAFDNRLRISVVMTSNINDLVSQTHVDFSRALPGLMTFTKDTDLDREVVNTRLHLERGEGRLLLICSKGTTSLQNISRFLRAIGAERYPTILFDDEGDQASLDTNTRRRSRSGVAVAPSAINAIIQNNLRAAVSRHVYVSVTGTPQAVLLQSADSTHRPSFIAMLPPEIPTLVATDFPRRRTRRQQRTHRLGGPERTTTVVEPPASHSHRIALVPSVFSGIRRSGYQKLGPAR